MQRAALRFTSTKVSRLQSGMGSSAASAVAGVVAVNALLDKPLPVEALLPFALEGEKFASGAIHADNVAPSLLGGLVLCPSEFLPRAFRVPSPDDICSVLVHPDLQVNTADSRNGLARGYAMGPVAGTAGLPRHIPRRMLQRRHGADRRLPEGCGHRAAKSRQCCRVSPQSRRLPSRAVHSVVHCPGADPAFFALVRKSRATNICTAMEQACRNAGYECRSWISPMNAPGAHIESA